MNLRIKNVIAGFLFLMLLFAGLPPGSQGQEEENIRASSLMDVDVYDKTEKLIGEVDDIVIRRSGKVKKLAVEFGGFLDIGDRVVGLYFKQFSMKNGTVVLDVTEQQLEKKPEIDYFRDGLRRDYYYRTRPFAGYYHYPPPHHYFGPNGPGKRMEPNEWIFSPERFLVSAVLNRHVINEEGKDIGRLEDLVIDKNDNKVEKIVLSVVDNINENTYVAVPYEPLGFSAYGLVYDIMPRRLKDYVIRSK